MRSREGRSPGAAAVAATMAAQVHEAAAEVLVVALARRKSKLPEPYIIGESSGGQDLDRIGKSGRQTATPAT